MNVIQVAGRLGADAETRFTPKGQKVTTLRLASNTKKGADEEPMWWRVTLWGDRFDRIVPYLKKGTGIIVVGSMQKPSIFQGRNGENRISLDLTAEMVMFSPFGSGKSTQQTENAVEGQQQPAMAATTQPTEAFSANSGDDLPF